MPLNMNTCPICMHDESRVTFTTEYLQKEIQVWRCKDCDFDFINTNLAPQQDSNDSSSETPEDIVERYYQNFIIDREVASKSLDKRMPIFSMIRGSDIKDVLEIGCGPGTAYDWFRKKNINWMGLDVDENALNHAKKWDIPVSSQSIDEITSKFDLIYFHQVLEHVMDPVDFLNKCKALMKPGGVIAAGVPNNNGFTAIFRRLLNKKYPLDYGFIQIPYHLRAYNKKSLTKLFNLAGLEVCEMNAVESFHETYGEWYGSQNSFIVKMIFKFGSFLGFGTLLYGIGKKGDGS